MATQHLPFYYEYLGYHPLTLGATLTLLKYVCDCSVVAPSIATSLRKARETAASCMSERLRLTSRFQACILHRLDCSEQQLALNFTMSVTTFGQPGTRCQVECAQCADSTRQFRVVDIAHWLFCPIVYSQIYLDSCMFR